MFLCYDVMWVELLHYWHITVGETYFIGEELHEIRQNSSNEEYTENKHSEGSNAEIDKEVDETETVHFRGKTMAEKNRKLPLLHYNQSDSFVYVSNRFDVKCISCYEKDNMPI